MTLCNNCGVDKPESSFHKDKSKPAGRHGICKECRCLKAKGYRKRFADKLREVERRRSEARKPQKLDYNKRYYQANRDAIISQVKEYRAHNSGAIKVAIRRWQQRNRAKVNATCAFRHAAKLRAIPAWANKFFMEEAYALAKLREKCTGIKWHVDHIVPLQSRIVCGLHCEQNLRVIPAVENLSKHNRYWPDMP